MELETATGSPARVSMMEKAMHASTRRAFLEEVGRGMLFASVGPAVLADIGLAPDTPVDDDRLSFGALEPLVCLMQETQPAELPKVLVGMLKSGTSLKTLVAAGALANARTFGGQDYVGYHCAMALVPALQMSSQIADTRLAPLPVLKVLVRNTTRMQERGGRSSEVLRTVPANPAPNKLGLLAAERRCDMKSAEAAFAAVATNGPEASMESLQALVTENIDVHQVVLTWRSWDLLRLTGREHAHTMLRQAMRQCVDREKSRVNKGRAAPAIRNLLPQLLEKHGLLHQKRESRKADDRYIRELAGVVFSGGRADAAGAVAQALAEGIEPEAVGEAISLASVKLLLHDRGRGDSVPGKPRGSVHGASVGVHASDATSAWRNIARMGSHRTRMASLVAGAWHAGGQGGAVNLKRPSHADSREAAQKVATTDLLVSIDAHVKLGDQGSTTALVERYGALGKPEKPLIDILLTHALRNDGALHHEKYFRTAFEEFHASRPRFRWLHLMALARVCASGHGFEAPGLKECARLL